MLDTRREGRMLDTRREGRMLGVVPDMLQPGPPAILSASRAGVLGGLEPVKGRVQGERRASVGAGCAGTQPKCI